MQPENYKFLEVLIEGRTLFSFEWTEIFYLLWIAAFLLVVKLCDEIF